MNTEQRCDAILEAVRTMTGTDPVRMMREIAARSADFLQKIPIASGTNAPFTRSNDTARKTPAPGVFSIS